MIPSQNANSYPQDASYHHYLNTNVSSNSNTSNSSGNSNYNLYFQEQQQQHEGTANQGTFQTYISQLIQNRGETLPFYVSSPLATTQSSSTVAQTTPLVNNNNNNNNHTNNNNNNFNNNNSNSNNYFANSFPASVPEAIYQQESNFLRLMNNPSNSTPTNVPVSGATNSGHFHYGHQQQQQETHSYPTNQNNDMRNNSLNVAATNNFGPSFQNTIHTSQQNQHISHYPTSNHVTASWNHTVSPHPSTPHPSTPHSSTPHPSTPHLPQQASITPSPIPNNNSSHIQSNVNNVKNIANNIIGSDTNHIHIGNSTANGPTLNNVSRNVGNNPSLNNNLAGINLSSLGLTQYLHHQNQMQQYQHHQPQQSILSLQQLTQHSQLQPQFQQQQQNLQQQQQQQNQQPQQNQEQQLISEQGINQNEPSKVFTMEQIKHVQQLIERCLKSYMSQDETMQHLCNNYSDIAAGFVFLTWGKLEEQNPDFFRAYSIRLRLKDQISQFNELVAIQAHQMHQRGVLVQNTMPVVPSAHVSSNQQVMGKSSISPCVNTTSVENGSSNTTINNSTGNGFVDSNVNQTRSTPTPSPVVYQSPSVRSSPHPSMQSPQQAAPMTVQQPKIPTSSHQSPHNMEKTSTPGGVEQNKPIIENWTFSSKPAKNTKSRKGSNNAPSVTRITKTSKARNVNKPKKKARSNGTDPKQEKPAQSSQSGAQSPTRNQSSNDGPTLHSTSGNTDTPLQQPSGTSTSQNLSEQLDSLTSINDIQEIGVMEQFDDDILKNSNSRFSSVFPSTGISQMTDLLSSDQSFSTDFIDNPELGHLSFDDPF